MPFRPLRRRLPRPVWALLIPVCLGFGACEVDNSFDPVPPSGRREIYGDLTVSTQREVDQLRGIHTIEGNLTVNGREITNLSGLADLRRITGQLNLASCRQVTDIEPLANLEELGKLRVRGCHRIVSLAPLNRTRGITWLEIAGCDSLTTPLSGACLSTVEVCNLEDLSLLSSLSLLDDPDELLRLTLAALPDGLEYGIIGTLTELREVTLRELQLTELPDLSGHLLLDRVRLQDMAQLATLAGLQGAPELNSIVLAECPLVTTLAELDRLPDLRYLDADRCDGLVSVASGDSIGNRATLTLYECNALTDLSGLASSWFALRVRHCDAFSSLSGLSADHTVKDLQLYSLPEIRDLEGIPAGYTFSQFSVQSCSSLETVAGLTLASTGTLQLHNLPRLSDLEGMSLPTDPTNITMTNMPLTDLDQLTPVLTVRYLNLIDLEMTSLAGLESLQTIGIRLAVSWNENLTDVNALATLQSIGGLGPYWDAAVSIEENRLLDSCALETIIAGWEIGGEIEITNNGPCAE